MFSKSGTLQALLPRQLQLSSLQFVLLPVVSEYSTSLPRRDQLRT